MVLLSYPCVLYLCKFVLQSPDCGYLIADKGSATEVLGVERTIEMQVSNLLSNF